MSASTPKLGLYQPGGGVTGLITPDEVADIDKLNDNFTKIDTAAGVTVCTSSTRPGTPFAGQQIYETNTKLSYVYSSSAWVLISVPVTVFVQSGTPTANATNDLWFY